MHSQKVDATDLPIQYVEPACRRDTPQLDHPENDSALTTMRRIGLEDPNNNSNLTQSCTFFNGCFDPVSTQLQQQKSMTLNKVLLASTSNTREKRRNRQQAENIDPAAHSSHSHSHSFVSDQYVESSILSSHRGDVGGGDREGDKGVSANATSQINNGGSLKFLYSSVKNALRDNINTLDFSRRHQDTKKQQLRYHNVNTQESEQSMIQDNDGGANGGQNITLNSQFDRRQSNNTEKAVGSLTAPFDYNDGYLVEKSQKPNLETCSSQKSFKRVSVIETEHNQNHKEQSSTKKSLLKGTSIINDQEATQINNVQEQQHQPAVRQSSRFYHTFSNDQQTTTGTTIRQRESIQSNHSRQRSSHKQLPSSAIDPSTPMFSSQKPTNALYQSMHVPTSSSREEVVVRVNHDQMQDPQIISRTLNLMKLNTNSSCQSLDQLRDEVLNLTIKRPQVIENDSTDDQPQIELSTEAIYIKPKKVAQAKKAPQSAGMSGNQLSRTQKLYFGTSFSHQQSKFTNASRILSPLSQQSTIVGGKILTGIVTPNQQKKPVVKKRPKSTGSTANTANTSIFKGNSQITQKPAPTISHMKSRSSAVSFSGLSSTNNNFNTQTLKAQKSGIPSQKLLTKTKKKMTNASTSKSRQPSQISLNQSSSFIRPNSRCPSSLSISNNHHYTTTNFKLLGPHFNQGPSRTFSPPNQLYNQFNQSTVIKLTNNQQKLNFQNASSISRPQCSSTVRKIKSNGSQSTTIKKKKSKSLIKSPYSSIPSQTTATNVTLKNQASRSTIVSFSGKQQQFMRLPSQSSQTRLLTGGNVTSPSNLIGKCQIIRKGLQKRGQAISDKNETVARMVEQKRELLAYIQKTKKEIMHNQKQVKAIRDNNKQSEDDIVRLADLVNQKIDRNQQLQRVIALMKRDVRMLQQDCEDFRQEKAKLMLKIESEYQLMDVVQRLIVNLKKQTNEVRREKERLQIAVRGEQRKAIDVISKRRTLITEESEKIYMDFKDTIGGAGNNSTLNTSMMHHFNNNGNSSRSQLHTPKGILGSNYNNVK